MAGLGGLAGLRGRLGEGPKGLGLSALPAVRCASTSTAARDAPSCPCSPQPCGRQCRKHGLAALASCPCSVQAIMNFAEHVRGAEIRRGCCQWSPASCCRCRCQVRPERVRPRADGHRRGTKPRGSLRHAPRATTRHAPQVKVQLKRRTFMQKCEAVDSVDLRLDLALP